MISVRGTLIGSTPVFVLPSTETEPWSRVWGAKFALGRGWVFPAYPPFGEWVLSDLRKLTTVALDDTAVGFEAACQHASRVVTAADADFSAKREVELPSPPGFKFPVKPFAHQRYGIAQVYAAWRWWLLWEMGTGKTAVIINLLRLLKAMGEPWRMLVVCPRIVVATWLHEVGFHSGGDLSAVDITRGDRGDRIAEANTADVAVVTYGIVRTEMRAAYNELLPEGFRMKGDYSDTALRRVMRKLVAADKRLYDQTVKVLGSTAPVSRIYKQLNYNMIVADESHCLGEFSSGTTKSMVQLSAKAARRYALTGTPADEPMQLYGQMHFLHPAIEPRSHWDYKQHHTQTDPLNKHLVLGYQNMHELNAKVDRIASRMKKIDCLDLPPLTITDIPVELGGRQRERYNELVREMEATSDLLRKLMAEERVWNETYDEDAETVTIPEIPQNVLMTLAHGAELVNKVLQVASGFLIINPPKIVCDHCIHLEDCLADSVKPYTRACKIAPRALPREILRDFENPKLATFLELAEHIHDQDPTAKVIVWATYLPELDDLEAACKDHKWGYVRVDGSSTHRIRELMTKFSDDPATWLYLGQSASGVGVTLTAANFTVYYSLPWNRKIYRQSFDRNYRAGQTRPVTAYRLLARDTLDEFVAHALQHKDQVAYTLTERVMCASCDRQRICGPAGVRPFRPECKYPARTDRPVARPREVPDGRPNSR